jgi:methionyl-tRNA formyltransferase
VNSLRLAFMGTPDFAVPALEALVHSSHDVVAVYTQPPRPAGRGHKLTKSPVQDCAERHGIPVYHPVSLKGAEAQAIFRGHTLDAAIVAAYGLILPQAILDAPRHGCVNIHASLLPRWRGAAPIQRAILAGDAETGITIMAMEAGLDTGPMLRQETLPILPTTTTPLLHDQLAMLGAKMILPALEGFVSGALQPMPQPQEGVTYAAKLTREDGRLDWSKPAAELERQIRALTPWPGSWFEFEGAILKVGAAEIVPDSGPPGKLLDFALTIACGEAALRLTRVQRPGRAWQDGAEFLRGVVRD